MSSFIALAQELGIVTEAGTDTEILIVAPTTVCVQSPRGVARDLGLTFDENSCVTYDIGPVTAVRVWCIEVPRLQKDAFVKALKFRCYEPFDLPREIEDMSSRLVGAIVACRYQVIHATDGDSARVDLILRELQSALKDLKSAQSCLVEQG